MHRFVTAASVALIALLSASNLMAHCQVPCGVYGDERRFEEMLEDTKTITKAMTEMKALAEKDDVLSHNQLARWVATKEAHASNTQEIIAVYFMTQRIKPTSDNYVKQLTAAHQVLLAAMKCKQTVDPANAEALEKAILDLYRAYEGKEPVFEHEGN